MTGWNFPIELICVLSFDDFQYFESDDKDLYRSKIKYIEETDPEDLVLVFAEEECDKHERLVKVREWTFVLHREYPTQKPWQELWTASDLTVLLKKTRRDETVALGKGSNTVWGLNLIEPLFLSQ